MSQLGFTFYPKDWWTSDSFYTLSAYERYIYLELLFMMYDNGGSIKSSKAIVERRLLTTIKDDVWEKITDLMVKDGDQITHESVNKRLRKAISNRQNGLKGGRPKKEQNLDEENPKKPKKPKKETQKNPPFKREREIEIEIEKEIENQFEVFWDKYGKKSDSKKCREKWMGLSENERTAALEKVDLYVSATPDVQYRKNPLTWINGKCWNDDVVKKNNLFNNGTHKQNAVFVAGRDVPTDKL